MVDLYKSRMKEIKAGTPREGEVVPFSEAVPRWIVSIEKAETVERVDRIMREVGADSGGTREEYAQIKAAAEKRLAQLQREPSEEG